ncbi:MAG: glycosyltransferase family 2 protein [Rhodothermales bacterium]
MPPPTLALCIPAYNASEYLPRLLTSAAEQTVRFDEVIVYDDCSADDTAAVAEAYGARVIQGDVNRGCSAGKNRLAEATACEWIHFHDADDDITLDLVERVRPHLERADAPDVLLLHFEYRDHATDEHLSESSYDAALLRRDPVGFVVRHEVPNFGVYRRPAFLDAGGFDLDPNVLYNEDVAFHHRLALAGLRFDYEPALTCLNYRYSGSMSGANQQRCARAQVCVLEKTTDVLRSRGMLAPYAADLAQKFWKAGAFAAQYEAWESAVRAAHAAHDLGGRTPEAGSPAFRALATLHGPTALRLRERLIRTLRPHLRASNPAQ